MRIAFSAVAAAALLSSASAAAAAEVFVANDDFEAGPAVGEGSVVAGHLRLLDSWTASGGSGTGHWNPPATHFIDEAEHGRVGYAYGTVATSPSSGMLAQTLKDYVIQRNTRYTLTLDVGRWIGLVHPSWGYDFALIGGELGAGASILARSTGVTGPSGATLTQGFFETVQLVFETGASGSEIGKALTIGLASRGAGIAYDNVRLDATPLAAGVPEPSTWAMMIAGFGLTGALLRRRRVAPA